MGDGVEEGATEPERNEGPCALLFAAGEMPPPLIWRNLLVKTHEIGQCVPLLVGIDKGAENAWRSGLEVDVIVGDLDSVDERLLELHPKATVVKPASQDESDLVKAMHWCNELGINLIHVVGVEGGRLDHQIGTFAALAECSIEMDITLHFRQFIAKPVHRSLKLDCEPGTHLSLFAFGNVQGVNMRGFLWELSDDDLAFSTIGLHNIVTSRGAYIERKMGDDGTLVALIGREVGDLD